MQKQYLDYTGLAYLVEKLNAKFAPIKAFVYKGSVADIASLPTVANVDNGSVYNVIAEGTTTSDFVEGAGKKLQANENVVAVNVGTEADPTMKWDILGGVFDFSDRLQFGTSMPQTDLFNGRTFLYLGETTYTYDEATLEGSENPKELGLYELDNEEYVLTQDETVVSGKTYYEKNEQYVQGVIYKYNTTTSKWEAQTAGDTLVAITNAEIDALFV